MGLGWGFSVMESKAQHLGTSQEENGIPLAQLGPDLSFTDAHLDYCQGWGEGEEPPQGLTAWNLHLSWHVSVP